MLNSALPVTIRERLLSEAVRRHEVSARALPAIEDLLRHGLSFEQALVGTGLVSSQTFAEWMQATTALPLLNPNTDDRALPPGLELETVLAWQIVPQKIAAKRWRVGLTNPWDQDVRAALEALAVEQGWSIEFAYVVPSVADGWLRALDQAKRSGVALRAYARSLVERMDKENALTVVQSGSPVHPRANAASVPASWLPALQLRLARRADSAQFHVRHHRHHRHGKIELTSRRPPALLPTELEHPIHEWTDTFQTFLDQGKLVFVLDQRGNLLDPWSELHVSHEAEDWRAGKRWLTAADPIHQEELFHLALAGYPGTVCFHSVQELRDWERAADQAQVDYATCVGHPTRHGIAWSLYSV